MTVKHGVFEAAVTGAAALTEVVAVTDLTTLGLTPIEVTTVGPTQPTDTLLQLDTPELRTEAPMHTTTPCTTTF